MTTNLPTAPGALIGHLPSGKPVYVQAGGAPDAEAAPAKPRSIEDHEIRLGEVEAEIGRIDAQYAGQKFPDHARRAWNELNEERDELKVRLAELKARHARMAELVKNPNAVERAGQFAPGVSLGGQFSDPWLRRVGSLGDRSRAAVDALHRDGALAEGAARLAERLVAGDSVRADAARSWMLAVSDPAYERAFGKLLRDPANGHRSFTPRELEAFQAAERAMALNPATAGGSLAVPFVLDPSIAIAGDGSIDPFRQVCRSVVIAGSDVWKGNSSEGVTAEWIGEGIEAADASPVVDSPEIPTYKADAFVPFSIEIDQDVATLRTELTRLFTDAKVQLEATAFTSGSGTGQPTGLLVNADVPAVTTGVAAYTADDAYALVEGVPPRFRAAMSVLASLPVINLTRRFTTDTEPEIVPASYGTWLGKPLHETSTLPDTVTTGSVVAVAGDFRQAVIVDRVGIAVELIPHLFGANRRPTGQRGLYAFWRVGFDVLVPNALRKLTIG